MHARRLSPTKSGSSLTSNGSISRSSLVGLGFDTSDEVVPLDEHYYGAYTDPQPSSANRSPLLGSTSPSPSPRLSTAPHFDTLSEASARLERRGSWQPLHAASSSSSSAVSTSASQPSLHVTSGRMSRSGSLNAVPLSIDTTQSALAFRPPSPTIRSYPMTSTASSSSAHQRQISLTSACLPATASYAPDRLKYASSPDEGATSTVSLRGSPNLRSTVDFDGPHASASSARNSHEREDSANARSKGKSSRKQWRVMRMFSPRIDEKGTSEMHSPVITDSPRVAACVLLASAFPFIVTQMDIVQSKQVSARSVCYSESQNIFWPSVPSDRPIIGPFRKHAATLKSGFSKRRSCSSAEKTKLTL